jgi:hypothetical protein
MDQENVAYIYNGVLAIGIITTCGLKVNGCN